MSPAKMRSWPGPLPSRADVLAEARTWIGTPFHHGQRLKGVACDCIGMAWGVGEATKALKVPRALARRYAGYGRTPKPADMRDALETCLVAVEDPQIADLAWIHWGDPAVPMHLAILGEVRGRQTLIHALSGRGVVEHGFTGPWPPRVLGWFGYPGLGA
jgi:NlpC/P60 family putative phage cell wall peptidase